VYNIKKKIIIYIFISKENIRIKIKNIK